MSVLTDLLIAHQKVSHPRAATDFAIMCGCGWETLVGLDELEYAPDQYLDPEPILAKRRADHIDAEVAKAGLVVVERRLLDDFTDPDPCQWSHNHSCQAHGYFYLDQGVLCPNEEAKRILAATEAPGIQS